MTTIAYTRGCLAADSKISSCGSFFGSVKKLVSGPPGTTYLAAASGNVGTSKRFLDWAAGGLVGDPPKMKSPEGNSAMGLILYARDRFLVFDIDGWNELEASIFAMGSGADFAKGALRAGATAKEAVRIASEFDNGTGGEIVARWLEDDVLAADPLAAIAPFPNDRTPEYRSTIAA